MSLRDFAKLLRTRWLTVSATTACAVIAALAITLLTTPLYQASTRLFVSSTGGASLADIYQGNRLSQERVLSYTELLMGETMAQRTVNRLRLDMTAQALQKRVTASSKPNTVLIDVDVLDESPDRARDIANGLSDEFVDMVRELETPEGASRPDARVVVEQRATTPETPAYPKTARNLTLGFVLGLLVGVALAVVRDVLDNTVKSQEALEELTGVGIVGSIPLDKERRSNPAIAFDKSNSAIAEAFRTCRTNLQFLAIDEPPRVIVITSSVPDEGKTTTAMNIALALAEADHNVVLVEGDMRRPVLDKYLDVVGSVGLSTVLSGKASLDEALQRTRFAGVTALTSGVVPPNPSELLGSLAAEKLLGELRARFDFVIVDSTPLLAVTDSAVLASSADGVIIIARFGHTKREQVATAVVSLKNVGARLLGAVLTMVPARGNTSYAYSYYRGPEGESPAPSAVKRAQAHRIHEGRGRTKRPR